MSRSTLTTALSLLVLSIISAIQPTAVHAQVSGTAGASYIGQWVLPLNAEGQQFSIDIDIVQGDDGNLAAKVSGFEGGSQDVEEISLDEGSLVLAYDASAQGQSFPVELTLTREGDALDADMDIADGAFAIDGTARARTP